MEIKPCPKCGGTDIIFLNCVDRLKCKKCGYRGASFKTKRQAVDSWNRRKG